MMNDNICDNKRVPTSKRVLAPAPELKPTVVSQQQPGELIRGRLFTPEKPATFNQLWTPEEQARLEELLLVYPDEPVAAHRWAKIAAALGNRTPRQVASRTQKHFIKLAKLGLPIPGKMPNLEFYVKNGKKSKKKKVTAKSKDSSETPSSPKPSAPPTRAKRSKKNENDENQVNDEASPSSHYASEEENNGALPANDNVGASLKEEYHEESEEDDEDYEENHPHKSAIRSRNLARNNSSTNVDLLETPAPSFGYQLAQELSLSSSSLDSLANGDDLLTALPQFNASTLQNNHSILAQPSSRSSPSSPAPSLTKRSSMPATSHSIQRSASALALSSLNEKPTSVLSSSTSALPQQRVSASSNFISVSPRKKTSSKQSSLSKPLVHAPKALRLTQSVTTAFNLPPQQQSHYSQNQHNHQYSGTSNPSSPMLSPATSPALENQQSMLISHFHQNNQLNNNMINNNNNNMSLNSHFQPSQPTHYPFNFHYGGGFSFSMPQPLHFHASVQNNHLAANSLNEPVDCLLLPDFPPVPSFFNLDVGQQSTSANNALSVEEFFNA